jgi:hypothetical protein
LGLKGRPLHDATPYSFLYSLGGSIGTG